MNEDELAILSVPTPAGKSSLSVPPSNTEHVYTTGRAFSFWPVVNGNGATWFEEEIQKLYANHDDPNLTFKGKLVNLDHSVGSGKGSMIIGVTLQEKYIAGVGVDVLNQLDRRALDDHGIKASDFAANGDYSKQSIEINCDRSASRFIVMVAPNSTKLSDQKVYSAEEAANMGLRRGELYDGKYKIVEACVPRRFRGVAMVSNPADTTAQVFDVAAKQESGSMSADTYEDSSALDNSYGGDKPISLNSSDTNDLDDGAFAVVQGGDEVAGTKPSYRKRELPLYESNKHHYSGIPHKGLIKAALVGLGQDKDGKRAYKPDVHSAALQKVRNAHSQLTGEYSMAQTAEEIAAIADPLKREIATIAEQLRVANEEKASGKTAETLKDERIALLETEIARQTEENKALKVKADDAAAAEVASLRLIDLSKVEGFVVVDTEKAALLIALGAESESDFKNRLLKEENASLVRKLAAKGTATDEKASQNLSEEYAGLKALDGHDVKLSTNSAYAALFDK